MPWNQGRLERLLQYFEVLGTAAHLAEPQALLRIEGSGWCRELSRAEIATRRGGRRGRRAPTTGRDARIRRYILDPEPGSDPLG